MTTCLVFFAAADDLVVTCRMFLGIRPSWPSRRLVLWCFRETKEFTFSNGESVVRHILLLRYILASRLARIFSLFLNKISLAAGNIELRSCFPVTSPNDATL